MLESRINKLEISLESFVHLLITSMLLETKHDADVKKDRILTKLQEVLNTIQYLDETTLVKYMQLVLLLLPSIIVR